jgi:hypothetical protein
MWSFWWILPLIGMLVCAAFFFLMMRGLASGRGFMCMGGHPSAASGDVADMRREIKALREEVQQLKAPR